MAIKFISYEEGERIKGEQRQCKVRTERFHIFDQYMYTEWDCQFYRASTIWNYTSLTPLQDLHYLNALISLSSLHGPLYSEVVQMTPGQLEGYPICGKGKYESLNGIPCLEVREIVYKYIMEEDYREIYLEDYYFHWACGDIGDEYPESYLECLPNLCLASKALYQEATPVWIRNCTWNLDCHKVNRWDHLVDDFLEYLPNGVNSVRTLCFENFSRRIYSTLRDSNEDLPEPDMMNFMAKFRGLQTLILRGNEFEAVTPDPDEFGFFSGLGRFKSKQIDEVISRYLLGRLVEHSQLTRIIFDIPNNYYDIPGGRYHLFEGIAQWLLDQYRDHKRSVTIEIRWFTCIPIDIDDPRWKELPRHRLREISILRSITRKPGYYRPMVSLKEAKQ